MIGRLTDWLLMTATGTILALILAVIAILSWAFDAWFDIMFGIKDASTKGVHHED